MLENVYLLAKIGADTAENERHVAEILPKICNYPTGPALRLRARRSTSGACADRGSELPLQRRDATRGPALFQKIRGKREGYSQ